MPHKESNEIVLVAHAGNPFPETSGFCLWMVTWPGQQIWQTRTVAFYIWPGDVLRPGVFCFPGLEKLNMDATTDRTLQEPLTNVILRALFFTKHVHGLGEASFPYFTNKNVPAPLVICRFPCVLGDEPRAEARLCWPPSSSGGKPSALLSLKSFFLFPEGSDSEFNGPWIHAKISRKSWKLS